MTRYYTEHPSTPGQVDSASTQSLSQLFSTLQSKNGLVLLGCVVIILIFSLRGNRKQGKLATSRFGSGKEKSAARKRAFKQLKERKRNAVSLYIGKPTREKDPKSLYLPDPQRGVAVCGGPGSHGAHASIGF